VKLLYFPDDVENLEFPKSEEEITEAIKKYINEGEITNTYLIYFWNGVTMNNYVRRKLLDFEKERILGYFNKVPKEKKYKLSTELLSIFLQNIKIVNRRSGKYLEIPLKTIVVIGYNKITYSMFIENNNLYIPIEQLSDVAVFIYIRFLETLAILNKSEIREKLKSDIVTNYIKKKFKVKTPKLQNEPPCITRIKEGVSEGMRNNALFALISFYKYLREQYNIDIPNEKIEEIVREANEKCDPPLPPNTVDYIISYHLYGGGKYNIYNFCGFIRKNIPELCDSDPKTCWKIMFSKSRTKTKSKKKNKKRN